MTARQKARVAAHLMARSRFGRTVGDGVAARKLGPKRPSTGDWRQPVDGRAPRLSSREFIGHDVRGVGAWKDRDPLKVPRLWSLGAWGGLLGWALTLGGPGWLSWRRHGSMDGLLGRDKE